MKVVISQNSMYFKSGLNKKILHQEKSANTEFIEKIFSDRYGIETQFSSNKSASLANRFCLSIFGKISEKLNLNLALPPSIFIYKKQQLFDKTLADNFCIQETGSVLNNEYPFLGRSIFFKDFSNLQEIDTITELRYNKSKTSSSHFLSPFIHEWLHSFHLDMVYKKFGYGGECTFMQQIYPNTNQKQSGISKLKELETKVLSNRENDIIFSTLGEYATYSLNQYQEIFSEAFTKFICDSLKGIELIKNPLDEFHKTNKEFQKILNKVLQLC